MGERKGETANFSGGAFIITNQRIMYVIRSILCRNTPDIFYPINTEIKQGKYLFIKKYIQLGNDKFFFNFPEAIPTIIDIQSKIIGNNSIGNIKDKYKLICNIGTRNCKDKAQLYADDKYFEIRVNGRTPRKIPIGEVYATHAGTDSIVDVYTKYSIVSMNVDNKNDVVSKIQKYIKELKIFDFDNNKESSSLLPKIIKSNFPYDMKKSNSHIQIIRKYGRLVAPINFDSLTEYFFFDVEELIKYDEKNYNRGLAALGFFIGNSLQMGLSGKEYILQAKLKSGYQCLVEAHHMINLTGIASIDALK